MRTIALLFALVLVFGMLSCQSGEKSADSGIAYFRQLKFSETPFDLITGNHEITADESKKVNHYKFTYDEESRLISVEYMRGDDLLRG
ncbi:MAG: hypothetical protein V3V53_16565, partial [Bacteroidales bacterium]